MREYWNKNKWTMLVTSVMILLPIVVGVLLWDKLPDSGIPFHWGINGEVDGRASKPVAVFLMPLVLLALQWLCFFVTRLDPKHKDKSPKLMGLMLWIIPVTNLLLSVMVYLTALDRRVDVSVVLPLFFGALFVVIGNYMPKCEPSYTLGIKLPWTLEDEQNWRATHRLAGWIWVAGGLLIMPCTLLPPAVCFGVMMGILVVMCAIPTVYSYRYYKKHKKDE